MDHSDCNLRLDCGEIEWKSNFWSKNPDSYWSKGMQLRRIEPKCGFLGFEIQAFHWERIKKVQMDSGIQLIIPSFWRLSQGSFVPLLQKAKWRKPFIGLLDISCCHGKNLAFLWKLQIQNIFHHKSVFRFDQRRHPKCMKSVGRIDSLTKLNHLPNSPYCTTHSWL